jgi:phage baseplate assembly protein W
MKSLGSTISFPFRFDERGTIATTANETEIIEQSIIDLIETRQGERKMLPNYGIPDLLFDVLDASFTARLAFFLEEQIRNYIPAIEASRAEVGTYVNKVFSLEPLPSPHIAAVRVLYTRRGKSPQELIYPIWRLRQK